MMPTPVKQLNEAYSPVVTKGAAVAPSWDEREQLHLLAKLLRPSIGVRRARTVAFSLFQRFGSLPEVISASSKRLQEADGVGRATARQIGTVLEVAQAFAGRRIVRGTPLLSSWSELIDYCHARMAYEAIERCHILYLDKKNRLIADEVHQSGTIDHCPVYVREIIKRALELGATAMVVVHNHPSGDPSPSSADVRITREIMDAGRPLGITLHDHIIVGRTGHVSLRGLKLL